MPTFTCALCGETIAEGGEFGDIGDIVCASCMGWRDTTPAPEVVEYNKKIEATMLNKASIARFKFVRDHNKIITWATQAITLETLAAWERAGYEGTVVPHEGRFAIKVRKKG